MRFVLRGKIHRATVTERHPDYVGSIVVDPLLLKHTDIWPGEKVLVSDADNGARFETYIFEGVPGSGTVSVNGGAAHLVKEGDKVIIMSFELTDRPIAPKVILVDDKNRYLRDISYTSPKIATAPIEKDLRADGQRLIVYSDGGSRNNPGPAACAYIICSEDGDILKKGSRYLGIMSNNEAEYHGLIDALTEAKELGAFEIAITMDSELVVRQVRGEYKIKAENLKPLFATVQGLLSSFRRYDILHAPREHPMISKADELVNIELDLMSQRTKL